MATANPSNGPFGPMSRRDVLSSALLAGAAFMTPTAFAAADVPAPGASPLARAPKRYDIRKSINQWAFPYPQKMDLRRCLELAKEAGFDGIELNYDLDNDLSPKSGTKEYEAIRKMADQIGITISGICSFLYWPYPLTSNDEAKRRRGLELAGLMARCAKDLGTKNVLVVPGAVCIPWRDDHEPVPNDVCDKRAREAIGSMVKEAEQLGVSLNIENIFFNGYLMTPMELAAFIDSFGSEAVGAHFDTGNIMMYQYPEHWIRILGKRIRNTHFKEFTKKGTDTSLESFRPLLDGTTDWPAVADALDAAGYRGYATFEYFHPYRHYPEALVHQTSDSLNRILGRR